jgi:seryl-tRNA synthetase
MLTVASIRENKDQVLACLAKKNFRQPELIESIVALDDQRKEIQFKSDSLLSEMNAISRAVGTLFQQGKKDEANQAKEKTSNIKDEIKALAELMEQVSSKLQEALVMVPNLPHESVPPGKSAEDNLKIRAGGNIPSLPANALPHWDLAAKYDVIDFELGNKLTGAGFPVYKDKGAKLQRALINFFLDEATSAGYKEFMPPLMVNADSGFGTGQLPDKEGQMYHVGLDNFYLIPTAEVPVTNIFRDVILSADELPVKCTAYTPCFRREAGSYGKDVRGLNRLHQFDKVEIVQIVHPDKSYEVLESMVAHVEKLVNKLELPYRIVKLCGGDMSFASALTYDFEVFAAAQDKWLEVSSVSNFESFQSNRLKCRFKEPGEKKTRLVHTLNGSALALPRIVAALLENNQTENGIKIPTILVPYTGFEFINVSK